MPFVKLDCDILDSSLWCESPVTRVVFLTMLPMAGSSGLVRATAPGIAKRAHLALELVRESLARLEAPDPDSRTLEDEGRRIRRVDGGYQIVNYLLYRNRDYTANERKRRQRERERGESRRDNRDGHDGSRQVTQAYAEADVEADHPPDPPSPGGQGDQARVPDAVSSGAVLAVVEQLAAEFIAAGGEASRDWRRQAKGELRARGLEGGAAVLRDQIAAQRARAAAQQERDQEASLVRRLVAQARAGGRDGVREWTALLAELERRVNPHTFGTWFRPPKPLGVVGDEEGDRLLVGVATDDALSWLQRNYQGVVNDSIDAAGLAPLAVLFVVAPGDLARAG